VMARNMVRPWQNAVSTQRFEHGTSRNNLWVEHASYGALWLAAHEPVEKIAWTSGEMAERDAHTKCFEGWYWSDTEDRQDGKKV
jgi:hypothetical protein